jgi:hypothetical protein
MVFLSGPCCRTYKMDIGRRILALVPGEEDDSIVYFSE